MDSINRSANNMFTDLVRLKLIWCFPTKPSSVNATKPKMNSFCFFQFYLLDLW